MLGEWIENKAQYSLNISQPANQVLLGKNNRDMARFPNRSICLMLAVEG